MRGRWLCELVRASMNHARVGSSRARWPTSVIGATTRKFLYVLRTWTWLNLKELKHFRWIVWGTICCDSDSVILNPLTWNSDASVLKNNDWGPCHVAVIRKDIWIFAEESTKSCKNDCPGNWREQVSRKQVSLCEWAQTIFARGFFAASLELHRRRIPESWIKGVLSRGLPWIFGSLQVIEYQV